MKRSKAEGVFFLTCAFSLAGTSVISAHYVNDKAGVFTITAAAMLLSVLFLLPLCAGELRGALKGLTRRACVMLFLQAAFGIFLFRLFLLGGMRMTSAGEAGILTGATPAVTTLLAWAVLREPIRKQSLAGIACTVGGVLLLQGVLQSSGQFVRTHFWGNMLVLCAAVCESLFNILSRLGHLKSSADKQARISPMTQTLLVSLIALALCLAPMLFEHPVQAFASFGFTEWAALLWYGVMVTAVAFICWYSGITRLPARIAAAFSGMMPLTAMVLSATLLREPATPAQWAGGGLVIVGMLLIH